MNTSKLSPGLLERLEHAREGELVDLVVELQPLPVGQTDDASRAERIASLREAFQREASPVEAAVRSAGGEVLGSAWINQSLRVRMPAGSVALLAELDRVSLLDSPRLLELEGS